MINYDVFNGDADGICALIQLRLAEPKESILITGVKRDIKLLDKFNAKKGDSICVLDVSMKKNQQQLISFLDNQVKVFYADHHLAGEIPQSPYLTALIDTQPNTCTSLIVHKHLQGKYPLWAITAAFGDNLRDSATQLANSIKLSTAEQIQLEKLGIYINYNGYGSCLSDLHFTPKALYHKLKNYTSPLDFLSENKDIFEQLEQGYYDDFKQLEAIQPEYINESIAVYLLPDEIWAKRVNGVFGNKLANQHPDRAHAVLSKTDKAGYQVSVRAPLNNKTNADTLCASFPSGGGRKAAAGINFLPKEQFKIFIDAFENTYRL